MTGKSNANRIMLVAAAIVSLLALPAHSQGIGKKGGRSGPPAENHPKVDEKAYKAALDRIPAPSRDTIPGAKCAQLNLPRHLTNQISTTDAGRCWPSLPCASATSLTGRFANLTNLTIACVSWPHPNGWSWVFISGRRSNLQATAKSLLTDANRLLCVGEQSGRERP